MDNLDATRPLLEGPARALSRLSNKCRHSPLTCFDVPSQLFREVLLLARYVERRSDDFRALGISIREGKVKEPNDDSEELDVLRAESSLSDHLFGCLDERGEEILRINCKLKVIESGVGFLAKHAALSSVGGKGAGDHQLASVESQACGCVVVKASPSTPENRPRCNVPKKPSPFRPESFSLPPTSSAESLLKVPCFPLMRSACQGQDCDKLLSAVSVDVSSLNCQNQVGVLSNCKNLIDSPSIGCSAEATSSLSVRPKRAWNYRKKQMRDEGFTPLVLVPPKDRIANFVKLGDGFCPCLPCATTVAELLVIAKVKCPWSSDESDCLVRGCPLPPAIVLKDIDRCHVNKANDIVYIEITAGKARWSFADFASLTELQRLQQLVCLVRSLPPLSFLWSAAACGAQLCLADAVDEHEIELLEHCMGTVKQFCMLAAQGARCDVDVSLEDLPYRLDDSLLGKPMVLLQKLGFAVDCVHDWKLDMQLRVGWGPRDPGSDSDSLSSLDEDGLLEDDIKKIMERKKEFRGVNLADPKIDFGVMSGEGDERGVGSGSRVDHFGAKAQPVCLPSPVPKFMNKFLHNHMHDTLMQDHNHSLHDSESFLTSTPQADLPMEQNFA